MDTSETYIKMCDCDEIQSQRKRISDWNGKLWMFNEDGDFVTNAKLAKLGSERATRATNGKNSPKLVWLPRQDQLQEMVTDTIDCPSHSSCAIFINVGHRIHQWCDDDFNYWIQFTSMEQLWLAFVMKEKYNKLWTGEKWN